MKKLFLAYLVIVVAIVISFNSSCSQKDVDKEESASIENTLKSVSLFQDSIRVEPAKLLASLERVNRAIDSIGYPDAGYQLWIVQSDTAANYRFMINGLWPTQEVYDEIHNNELYKNAMEGDEELWNNMKSTWYDRFTRVK